MKLEAFHIPHQTPMGDAPRIMERTALYIALALMILAAILGLAFVFGWLFAAGFNTYSLANCDPITSIWC